MRLSTAFNRVLASAVVVAAGVMLPQQMVQAASADVAAGAIAGEVMVKLGTSSALQPLLAKYPLALVSRFGARPIYRLKVVGAATVPDVLAALALEPSVMLAEANSFQRSPEARKNVPWAIGSAQTYATQWAPQAMRLAQAHRLTTGAGARVAVLDTGVDASHPMLAGRLLPGRDFVDGDADPSEVGSFATHPSYGHGTHVAGLLAMVAPGARIMPLRVLDADGVGNAWVLAEALLYAIDPDGNPNTDDGAQVINLSLGSLERTRLFDTVVQIVACTPPVAGDPVADRSDPGYQDDATRCLNRAGTVVVAAAGNDGSKKFKNYPAAEGSYGLMSVGASNAASRMAAFSNFGSWVDAAAPGDAITSALPGGGYGTWGGTSMAAPLAAGTAALLRSMSPTMAPQDIVKRLARSGAWLCDEEMRQIDALASVTGADAPRLKCR